MNKKLIAVIALAAGIAAYVYNKKKNKINEVAEDAYDTMHHTLNNIQKKTEDVLS